ncbi:MAG TPA: DUF1634 domain-containing protein [Planctomycetaceae bacterium]|jgi:uncharacterized membrane protein|nr:DUF1634 domain-containing protein [Planctomycetaceae bacterium]
MNDAESRSRRWVQRTLACGLAASALLLIAGAVLVFTRHEGAQQAGAFKLVATVSRAAHGDGTAVMTIGLLILMLTPVARVIVLGLDWLLERERLFAAVAATVLTLLVISVVLGTG